MFQSVDNEGLLRAIDNERLPPIQRNPETGKIEKLPEPDDDKLRQLIDEAVRRGIYPRDTHPSNPNDVYSMVRGYGARWFEWSGPLECPHCHTDLRAEEGPPFKREIGISENDRCTGFICPDCKKDLAVEQKPTMT